jgi:murein DD-endopeptidase MepM/ murein hydrolase activator NlpD
MNKISKFTLVSWGLTLTIVLAVGSFAFWRMQNSSVFVAAPVATSLAAEDPQSASIPPGSAISMLSLPAIGRSLTLKTVIPDRPHYAVTVHTVARGDSVFAISKEYSIKPDSLLWANYDVLNDSPDSLRPGQELNIPPTNGILYKWKTGDTLAAVATKYKASSDDILNWPGNNVDLTNPSFTDGELVMIPGGSREYKQWLIPTIARGRSGTTGVSGSACSGGPVGSGAFIWPAGNHFLSGNDYYAGHLGIDIAAGEGASIYAADAGVVVKASGGYNGGYGNVIMIDHGNGFATLYAHLSQINVTVCQGVGAGTLIGMAGNTGNSTGAHLHFEVRKNGGFINPWSVLGQ